MGTRSTIALEFADGSVSQVYCHWDGYLDNNGKILSEHYMNPFKVRDLVELGDFSSLRETVEATAGEAYTQRGEDKEVRRYMDVTGIRLHHAPKRRRGYVVRSLLCHRRCLGANLRG